MGSNNRNLFGFTSFVAAASLGLGLLAAGCGDSGSTTPAPLGPTTETGTVTFEYAQATSRTTLEKTVAFVDYTFQNAAGVCVTDTDLATLQYGTNNECDVVVSNVAKTATGVVSYYYNSDYELVGFGYDTVAWNSAAPYVATVASPDYNTDFAGLTNLTVVANPQVVDIGEKTEVDATAVYYKALGSPAQVINVNNMGVTFAAKSGYLTQSTADPTVFAGKSYGEETVTATPTAKLSGLTAATVTVYVTDAVVTGLVPQYANMHNSKTQTFLVPDYDFGFGAVGIKDAAVGGPSFADVSTVMGIHGLYTTKTADAPTGFDLPITDPENVECTYTDNNSAAKSFTLVKSSDALNLVAIKANKATAKDDAINFSYPSSEAGGEDITATVALAAVEADANIEGVVVPVKANGEVPTADTDVVYPNGDDGNVPLGLKVPVTVNGYYTFTYDGTNVESTANDVTEDEAVKVTAKGTASTTPNGLATKGTYKNAEGETVPAYLVSSSDENVATEAINVAGLLSFTDADKTEHAISVPIDTFTFIAAVETGKYAIFATNNSEMAEMDSAYNVSFEEDATTGMDSTTLAVYQYDTQGTPVGSSIAGEFAQATADSKVDVTTAGVVTLDDGTYTEDQADTITFDAATDGITVDPVTFTFFVSNGMELVCGNTFDTTNEAYEVTGSETALFTYVYVAKTAGIIPTWDRALAADLTLSGTDYNFELTITGTNKDTIDVGTSTAGAVGTYTYTHATGATPITVKVINAN